MSDYLAHDIFVISENNLIVMWLIYPHFRVLDVVAPRFPSHCIQICNKGLHGRFNVREGANLLVSAVKVRPYHAVGCCPTHKPQVVSKMDNIVPNSQQTHPQVTPSDSQTDLMQINSYAIA